MDSLGPKAVDSKNIDGNIKPTRFVGFFMAGIKISKKSQYGLRALVYLARFYKTKEIKPLRDISKAEGISFDFLDKILSRLEKFGLVKSKKGAGGGYFLAKNPGMISAGDIVEVLEGKIIPVECSLCGKSRKCLSKNVWDRVKQSLASTLYSISLNDLIK